MLAEKLTSIRNVNILAEKQCRIRSTETGALAFQWTNETVAQSRVETGVTAGDNLLASHLLCVYRNVCYWSKATSNSNVNVI